MLTSLVVGEGELLVPSVSCNHACLLMVLWYDILIGKTFQVALAAYEISLFFIG